MSAKISSRRIPGDAVVKKDTAKVPKQKKDVKQCLKLLSSGQLQLSDIDDILEEFHSKPHLGDRLQYELHKYCQQESVERNTDLVVRLAGLCYSSESVSNFSSVDRFVGCIYYISSYLLKLDKYESALSIINSLEIKKDEILQAAVEKPDLCAFIYNIHSSFISSAINIALKLKSCSDEKYKISQNLVLESLKIFKLIKINQVEVGRKVLKTSVLYLQTIKHYRDDDVYEFYKLLTEVLKIFFPKIGNLDFCFYYLSKLNTSKKLDSKEEIVLMLRKTINLLLLFVNASAQVKHSLDKMVEFFFVNDLSGDWIDSEDFDVLNLKESHSQLHFVLVSSIFSYGVQFLWKKYEDNWCENISTDLVKNISNSLLHFHRHHCRTKSLYCSSEKQPFEACFGDLLTGNLQKIQYTIRLCLKHKVSNSLSLISVSRDAFRLAMECLEFMESRGCSQEQRIYCWKFSVIHHTNTVEDICRYGPSGETWVLVKECSQEILREVVNSKVELPFEFKRVSILFQRWHIASLKLKNYRDALYACVVYYVFYPKEEKEMMTMWLQAKSESCNEIIEEITMYEILKTCDGSLREFSKSYDSSKITMKSVLLMELRAYSTCSPDIFQNPNTAYQLTTRIWKQLEKTRLDLWETSFALSSIISVNIAGDNKKLSNGILDKCKKLINEFLQWQGKSEGRSLVHAGNLTFSLFLYNMKLAESSEGKMDTSQMVLGYLKKAEEEKVKFGEDVDLNLSCDVIPSSSHLTVARETNYLNELNDIVDLWNRALKSNLTDAPFPLEYDLWQRNVKQVANLYRLYGEYRRAFTTWLIYYRIGKLCNDSTAVLLGLSHLIENCSDVDASGVKEEAELISEKLGSETSEKYVVVEYALAVASNYLKNYKTEKCLEYLTIAKKLLEGLRTTITTHSLNSKLWCLVNKFLLLHKEYEAVFDFPPNTDPRVMAFKAFSYANYAGRSDLIRTAALPECMELVLTMLEVNIWAYYLHGVYRQTDFMRFFLDDLYRIVQKLFLPTRTAEILLRLAEVDVICEKVEDCQGKMNKLKSILTTLSSRCGEIIKPDYTPSSRFLVPDKSDFDVPSPRPISPARFLDKPPNPATNPDLSPFQCYLLEKPPNISQHLNKCKCRLCQNILIQTLTFNTIWLEAEMYNLSNRAKEAAKCFSQGFEMLNKLELLRAEQSQILRVELAAVLKEVPGEVDFQLGPVQFVSARFLMKYALFEMSSPNAMMENVIKTMLRVSTLMKKFSYERKLLQWSFAELKLGYLVLGKEETIPRKKKSSRLNGLTPIQFKPAVVTKTPCVGSSSTLVPNEGNRRGPKNVTPMAEAKKKPEEDANDPMNTAFVGEGTMHTVRKQMHPRKLNFDTNEPEGNTKTVKKMPAERGSVAQSRRLNFDDSVDLFEDAEPREKPLEQQKKTLRTRNRQPTAVVKAKNKSEQVRKKKTV